MGPDNRISQQWSIRLRRKCAAGKKVLLVILLIAGSAGGGFGQDRPDSRVEFEGVYRFSGPRAGAQISGQTYRGAGFNPERDLGIRDRDIASGRFTWYTGPRSRLFLEYGPRNFAGDMILSRRITFRDTVYDTGSGLPSDLTVGMARFGWVWQFIDSGDGRVRLGTLFEARGIFTDLLLNGRFAGAPVRSENTGDIGFPTFGLALDINPSDRADLYLKASGMSFGRYGYISDGEAGIKLMPSRTFSFSGGYRMLATEVRGTQDGNRIRLAFNGPFAAVSMLF